MTDSKTNSLNYQINIKFHYPHDRLALGWEYIAPNEEYQYSTITLYLLIITLDFNYETN